MNRGMNGPPLENSVYVAAARQPRTGPARRVRRMPAMSRSPRAATSSLRFSGQAASAGDAVQPNRRFLITLFVPLFPQLVVRKPAGE